MIYHARAARRGAPDVFLVVDMPFLSFQISPEDTLRNAGRVMKETGAQGVKLEGGARLAETVRRLTDIGIPVMGHLGLTPQSIHTFGGYGLRAGDETSADELVADAIALSEAGCFAIVLEKIPRDLGARVTAKIPAITLGIGAGPETDGQILVTHDVLGMTPNFKPKFVRRYADLDQVVAGALEEFVTDVRAGRFPGEAESFE
jgi:3-methyl-2-oxobutanoate hydroxymethyltransferase